MIGCWIKNGLDLGFCPINNAKLLSKIFPFPHPLVRKVLRPSNLQFRRYIQKCTLPRVLILVMMSSLLKILEYDHLNISRKEHEIRRVSNCDSKATCFPVDKRCRFKVYKASIRYCRRRIDVETTSCVYMFRDYHYSPELALDSSVFLFWSNGI